MEKKMIMNYKKRFDEIRHEENGVEFWYARELMHLLDYSKWQNFENVLLKAKVACANNGIVVEEHFADASKMVILGSGANREVEDYMLTRYAWNECYSAFICDTDCKFLVLRGSCPCSGKCNYDRLENWSKRV